MRYLIDAWLDEGDPHLRIIDADSGSIRLNWVYPRSAIQDVEHDCNDKSPCGGCSALHCLLNHLFLLSCIDKLHSCEACSIHTEHRIAKENILTGQRVVLIRDKSSDP
jgi:hypothetical protein